MIKENIRIKRLIVHILDPTIGMPVLSDTELEYGSEVAEFVREHIGRIGGGDDARECRFYEQESEICRLLSAYEDENFVQVSQEIAGLLFEIMSANIDIPPADLMVARFREGEEEYLALLKMNYKAQYTHRTMPLDGEGNSNELIRHKSILPSQTQRLTEAALIRLSDLALWVVEKKYEVNGEKTDYFSFLFLKCSAHLSHKSKLAIVGRAVESVQKDGFAETERFERQMRAKSIIQEEIEENGGFAVEEIADKIFDDQPELKTAFQDKMEKYNMVKETIEPKSENTTRKYQSQHLYTDTGIEIKIPMEQYKNPGCVEFITNPDGTVSVLIKNIGHLEARI